MSALETTQSVEACPWFVYALIDPRDHTIRYVGATYNLEQRIKAHLSESSHLLKYSWISDLKAQGLVPQYCVLETGTTDQAIGEQGWINRFRAGGLLNVMGVGSEHVERVKAGVRHAQKHGTKSGKPIGRLRVVVNRPRFGQ
jgi:hypothetical protein